LIDPECEIGVSAEKQACLPSDPPVQNKKNPYYTANASVKSTRELIFGKRNILCKIQPLSYQAPAEL